MCRARRWPRIPYYLLVVLEGHSICVCAQWTPTDDSGARVVSAPEGGDGPGRPSVLPHDAFAVVVTSVDGQALTFASQPSVLKKRFPLMELVCVVVLVRGMAPHTATRACSLRRSCWRSGSRIAVRRRCMSGSVQSQQARTRTDSLYCRALPTLCHLMRSRRLGRWLLRLL
jgi:hypothetical protein